LAGRARRAAHGGQGSQAGKDTSRQQSTGSRAPLLDFVAVWLSKPGLAAAVNSLGINLGLVDAFVKSGAKLVIDCTACPQWRLTERWCSTVRKLTSEPLFGLPKARPGVPARVSSGAFVVMLRNRQNRDRALPATPRALGRSRGRKFRATLRTHDSTSFRAAFVLSWLCS
jgi:hypothetical protein